jgi:hypothetical protein
MANVDDVFQITYYGKGRMPVSHYSTSTKKNAEAINQSLSNMSRPDFRATVVELGGVAIYLTAITWNCRDMVRNAHPEDSVHLVLD